MEVKGTIVSMKWRLDGPKLASDGSRRDRSQWAMVVGGNIVDG